MNIKKIMVSSMVFAVFAVLLSYWYTIYSKQRLDFSCSTYFTQEGIKNEYHLTANFVFFFNKNGEGIVSMDGDVMSKDNNYILRRDMFFNYKNRSPNVYEVFSIKTMKAVRDNTPDIIMEMNFFPTSIKSGRLITISKLVDDSRIYIIGSIVSPAFMCRST